MLAKARLRGSKWEWCQRLETTAHTLVNKTVAEVVIRLGADLLTTGSGPMLHMFCVWSGDR